jgi:hypothetical protein
VSELVFALVDGRFSVQGCALVSGVMRSRCHSVCHSISRSCLPSFHPKGQRDNYTGLPWPCTWCPDCRRYRLANIENRMKHAQPLSKDHAPMGEPRRRSDDPKATGGPALMVQPTTTPATGRDTSEAAPQTISSVVSQSRIHQTSIGNR